MELTDAFNPGMENLSNVASPPKQILLDGLIHEDVRTNHDENIQSSFAFTNQN
jgi:hypothetical protein